jgi:hypothetical protein
VAIAARHGVLIAEDAAIILDEWGLITKPEVDATYLHGHSPQTSVAWSDFFALSGKIPVLVRERVLRSDEAIVAVLAHEMHELHGLRELFSARSGVMSFRRLWDLIRPGVPGNLHDQAWEVADRFVARMREGS